MASAPPQTGRLSPQPLSSRFRSVYASIRPWRLLFDLSALSRPVNYVEVVNRIRRNVSYFRRNYSLIALVIIFCSLIFHPISMIVFLIVFVVWILLYFGREEPLAVMGRNVDDRIVLVVLSLATVVALVLTHVGLNVLVSLIIGVVVIGVHSAFRDTWDLSLSESEAVEAGLLSVVS